MNLIPLYAKWKKLGARRHPSWYILYFLLDARRSNLKKIFESGSLKICQLTLCRSAREKRTKRPHWRERRQWGFQSRIIVNCILFYVVLSHLSCSIDPVSLNPAGIPARVVSEQVNLIVISFSFTIILPVSVSVLLSLYFRIDCSEK